MAQHYKAANVRDVAWASSRKFIWDAQGVNSGGKRVLAMSYYPNEGNPLWQQYSREEVVHAIEQYSKYSFDYPYPVALSVNGAVGGMEYPMLAFNGGRPVKDKKTGVITYSRKTKYQPDQRDYPRGRPQLFSDDRQLRRAPVGLDGRGLEFLPAVPGRAGIGRPIIPRGMASRARSSSTCAAPAPGADHDQSRIAAAA